MIDIIRKEIKWNKCLIKTEKEEKRNEQISWMENS
jgi:hypothetical protein